MVISKITNIHHHPKQYPVCVFSCDKILVIQRPCLCFSGIGSGKSHHGNPSEPRSHLYKQPFCFFYTRNMFVFIWILSFPCIHVHLNYCCELYFLTMLILFTIFNVVMFKKSINTKLFLLCKISVVINFVLFLKGHWKHTWELISLASPTWSHENLFYNCWKVECTLQLDQFWAISVH